MIFQSVVLKIAYETENAAGMQDQRRFIEMRFRMFKQQESSRGIVTSETLRAFNKYIATSSWLRVAVICCLAMVPSFVAMMLIELMPLAPMKVGWDMTGCFGFAAF